MGGCCSIYGCYSTPSQRTVIENLPLISNDDDTEEIIVADRNNNTDALLKKYYENLVKLRFIDKERYVHLVHAKIEEILQHCHEIDGTLPSKPRYVGSYPQGLKVGMPNEFDVDIQMDIGTLTGPFRKPMQAVNFRLCHSPSGNILWTDQPIKENLEQYKIINTAQALPTAALGYGSVALQDYFHVTNASDMVSQGLLVPFLVKLRFHQVLQQVLKNDKHKSIRT